MKYSNDQIKTLNDHLNRTFSHNFFWIKGILLIKMEIQKLKHFLIRKAGETFRD